jgi:hypothetical protein
MVDTLSAMAIGKDSSGRGFARTTGDNQPVQHVQEGNFGRVSPAPDGGLYVRDPQAAAAAAIRRRVKAFELAGKQVPRHLQKLLEGLKGDEGPEIDLVDAITGESCGGEVVVDAPEGSGAETPPPPAGPPNPESVTHEVSPVPDQSAPVPGGEASEQPAAPAEDLAISAAVDPGQPSGAELRVTGAQQKADGVEAVTVPEVAPAPAPVVAPAPDPTPAPAQAAAPKAEPKPEPKPTPEPVKAVKAAPAKKAAPARRR